MSSNQYNPSASTPPTTPTQTGQVNRDIDQARDIGPNNTSPNSIRIGDYIPDMSAEIYRELTEAINSQNNEPVVCMSEFWTLSANTIDLYTDSETPVAAAMENLTIRHGPDTMRRPDTPLPTGGVVENGNAPQRDLFNQPSISVNDLLPSIEIPTSELLAMYAPFGQYPEDDASSAAPSEGSLHINSTEINHTNLQTNNSGRSGNPGNPGVSGVTTFGNAVPTTHRVTNGGAPSENTTANNQTNPANPIRRNRRPQRSIPSFNRMTPEEREAFWREFSDTEDDGETNDGAQDQDLVVYANSILEPMNDSYRRAMSLDGDDSENNRGST